jgi:membrane-associated protein
MFEWLTHFWYHLHNTEGLKETIQMGGIALLFLIIFTETGLLVGFFLPGDSLLVTAGVLSATNGDRVALFDPWTLCFFLIIAAVLGDQTGWWLGNKYGHRVMERPDGWLVKKKHIHEAHEYFTKGGAFSIVLARYVPILRTFVPFVAGMGEMPYTQFFRWNVIGGILWITSLIWLGHWIGGTPLADKLHKVILIVIVVSFIPLIWKIGKRFLTSRAKGTKS